MLKLAGCIIQNKDGHVLLIHRNTDKYTHWEVPGGKVKVERGETADEAAVRELREELGIEVDIKEPLGAVEFVDRGKPMHYSWFAATILEGEPRIVEPHLHDDFRYINVYAADESLKLSLAAEGLVKQIADGHVQLSPLYACE
jgi:8-oxo-dGTP diphosphatase